jgi:hypothetical protein
LSSNDGDDFTILRLKTNGDPWDAWSLKILPSGTYENRLRLRVIEADLDGENAASDTTIPINEWTHVAGTIETGVEDGVKIFINGVLQSDTVTVSDIYVPDQELVIGSSWENNDRFIGAIDDVRIYDRILGQNEIEALYSKAIVATPLIDETNVDNLVGHWSFNSSEIDWDDAAFEIRDRLGKNDGDAEDALGSEDLVTGMVNQALEFNNDSHIQVYKEPELKLGTGDGTVAAWIKINDAGTHSHSIYSNRGSGTENNGMQVRVTEDKLCYGINAGTWNIYCGSTTGYGDDEWHHVAVVFDRDDKVSFYKDGVLVDDDGGAITAQSGNALDSSCPTAIGAARSCSGTAVSDELDGILDEVRYYNHALKADEIAKIYNAR